MFMLRARTYFGSSFKKSRLVDIWALNGHWSSNIRDTSAARLATAPSDDDAVHKQPPELIPEAYIKANRFQRNVNIRTLDLLQMSFGSAPNRSQQFIDLGCGTGDFTRQELLPRCQPCRRMVATDVSPGMVKYAKEKFAHPQIAHEVHDIESDVSGLLKKYGKFERVYSFFVLNWAEDLGAALRNVAALMTDDGECLLVFPARLSFYVLWREIVELDRWKPYKGTPRIAESRKPALDADHPAHHQRPTSNQIVRDTSAARLATAPSDDDAVHKQPPELIPEAYIKANRFQRNVNIRTLDLLQMSFGSAPNRSQQFIDLGCGTGDFTRQELLPRCQPCRRMVATDVSPGMVKYAKENFAHPQIAYEVHDIESDVSGLLKKYGKFERVYSFFVLNWAEDLGAALRNVAALMTDEGECLLVFPARLSFYVLWRKIVELDRWKPYKGVIERFIPSSQDIEERSALTPYMLDILESANLKPRTCEVISVDTSGEDVDEFIVRDTSAARLATAPSDDDAVHKQPPELIPEAYIKANRFQRNVNIRTLDLLQMSFGSAPNRSQQFIDLGCGTGDFTRQELLPRCQPCRRMVATDVSPGMVKYAKENFAHPQIAYEVHDIESDVSGLLKKYGKFERVYSFFVLNWAEDLGAALRNVAALMTDDGECLLVFPARLSFYVLWREIVELDRWKPYKGDIEERSALTPYMLDILESANLKPRTCEVISVDTSGEDVDEFIAEGTLEKKSSPLQHSLC
ncbi:putative acid methyltransferase [Ixodes scapularis]